MRGLCVGGKSPESGSPKSKVINLNWTCVRRQSTLTEIEIRERERGKEKRNQTRNENEKDMREWQ